MRVVSRKISIYSVLYLDSSCPFFAKTTMVVVGALHVLHDIQIPVSILYTINLEYLEFKTSEHMNRFHVTN